MQFTTLSLFVLFQAVIAARFVNGQVITPVAFSVALTDDLPDLEVPVLFNVEDVDIGDDFNGTTFTVPVTGLYFFSFAIKSYDGLVHMKVNDVITRSTVFSDTTDRNADNMAAGTAVLYLNSGETVQLFLSQFGSAGLINTGDVTGVYTSFSGMLLHQSTVDVKACDAAKSIQNDPDLTVPDIIFMEREFTDINSCFWNDYQFETDVTGIYMISFMGKGDRMLVHLYDRDRYRRSAIRCNTNGHEENVASNTVILGANLNQDYMLHQGSWGDGLTNRSPSNGVFTSINGVPLSTVSSLNVFSATRTGNMANVSTDTVIAFDRADLNVGGNFYTNGTFVAQARAYYFFTFTIKSSVAAAHLKHNGVVKRSVITTVPGCAENTVQNFVILPLSVGDKVELYLDPYGDVGLVEDMDSNTGGIFTSFSGFQLYAA